MTSLPVRRPATHTLVIEVPLHLTGDEPRRFDPVQDALRMVMALSRVAAGGYVCDEVHQGGARTDRDSAGALLVRGVARAARRSRNTKSSGAR